MDSSEAAELIAELHEEKAEAEQNERFRNGAALLIAFLAAILAIGGLGGGNATDDYIDYNIRANDTWAFFQAKNMRQTLYEVAADEVEAEIAAAGAATPAQQARLDEYRATVARYDSEPDPQAPHDITRGEGKRELRARAEMLEAERDRAAVRDANFDLAEVALQIALVLGSVAILALSKPVLILSGLLGVIGTLLTANGFLLLFPLPF